MSRYTTINQSKRKLLKTIACGSAASLAGLSGVVMANSVAIDDSPTKNKADQLNNTVSNTNNSLTVFNQTDKTIQLDITDPVNLQEVNGWVVVNINKASSPDLKRSIDLAPGQSRPFTVDPELAPMLDHIGNYVVITSEFTVLNNMIPVSLADVAIA